MDITKTAKITGLDYSAERWELFTCMKGVEKVAAELNETFMTTVNNGGTRDEVEDAMNVVMLKYSDFGAEDSEPEYHLQKLLDKVFGNA